MINTPKAVATETRKALRKLPNLESALNNLSSLKGVGTTMATGMEHFDFTILFVGDEVLQIVCKDKGLFIITVGVFTSINFLILF